LHADGAVSVGRHDARAVVAWRCEKARWKLSKHVQNILEVEAHTTNLHFDLAA
jgi:hypothetical protein